MLRQQKIKQKSIDVALLNSEKNQSDLDKSLSNDLQENYLLLKQAFDKCSDVIFREISIQEQMNVLMIYTDGMADAKAFEQTVLKPLLYDGLPQGLGKIQDLSQACERELFSILDTQTITKTGELITAILSGQIAILVEHEATAFVANLKNVEKRAVQEPKLEASIRGPREGFTESLRVNTSLIRKRIPSHKLKMESFKIGKITQTNLVVMYIDSIVNESVLSEVKKRIGKIETDEILDSEYIEEWIEDVPFSPFPQIQNTERPDIATSCLLEGKVVIITDTTPCCLIAPMTFWVGLQAADDYYDRFMYVNAMRIVRFTFALAALLLPAFYVMLTTYHQGMIPQTLMISIAAARETSPFPTAIETVIMELIFEGLQEAGLRLPNQIGPLVSIVGALVIGEAAVQAGFISAPIVIIVAATGISSYVIPRYSFGYAFRILRFVLLILASSLGLIGMSVGIMAILIHLVRIQSFGVPYFAPVAPRIRKQMTDLILRVPKRFTKPRR